MKALTAAVLAIILVTALALAQGWIVAGLWNYTLAAANGSKEISTWQGLGLLGLFTLLNKNVFSGQVQFTTKQPQGNPPGAGNAEAVSRIRAAITEAQKRNHA